MRWKELYGAEWTLDQKSKILNMRKTHSLQRCCEHCTILYIDITLRVPIRNTRNKPVWKGIKYKRWNVDGKNIKYANEVTLTSNKAKVELDLIEKLRKSYLPLFRKYLLLFRSSMSSVQRTRSHSPIVLIAWMILSLRSILDLSWRIRNSWVWLLP